MGGVKDAKYKFKLNKQTEAKVKKTIAELDSLKVETRYQKTLEVLKQRNIEILEAEKIREYKRMKNVKEKTVRLDQNFFLKN